MTFQKLLYLRRVLRNSKLPQHKLESLQNRKLSQMVSYCFNNVNYYRKIWKQHNIKPKDIRSMEDIRKLPSINKKIVQENHSNFISNDYRRYLNVLQKRPSFLFMRSTSGTTGKPTQIYFDPDSYYFLEAVYARALLTVGYNPLKPLLYYWWQQTQQKNLYHLFGLFKKIYVPIKWNEKRQLEFMLKKKPEYIYYYPSALYFISRIILHQNEEINFKPHLIITHGELLSETIRKVIENAFDSNVYDQYGTNEFNRIAWECRERNGYHIDADSVIIEVVDENYEEVADGELGKVLITGLVNKAFPLIRYEIGDFVIKSDNDQKKHNCGINLPVGIKSIEGRYEHSMINVNEIITQRFLMEKILSFLNERKDLSKFQVFLNNQDKEMLINYTTFTTKDGPENTHNENKLDNYKIISEKVKDITKNEITGKILLLEKSI